MSKEMQFDSSGGDLTLDTLKAMIAEASWFSQLGQFPGSAKTVAIRDLTLPAEPEIWDWLPTVGLDVSPEYTEPLYEAARLLGREADMREQKMAYYQLTLRSLRHVPDAIPLLRRKPSNVTPAAKGAACIAFALAACEIVVDRQAFWCSLVPYYVQGYWPCGITDDEQVIVL